MPLKKEVDRWCIDYPHQLDRITFLWFLREEKISGVVKPIIRERLSLRRMQGQGCFLLQDLAYPSETEYIFSLIFFSL